MDGFGKILSSKGKANAEAWGSAGNASKPGRGSVFVSAQVPLEFRPF